MKEHFSRVPWVLLVIVMGLGGFSLAVAGLAVADPTPSAKTLARTHDPVVITGDDVFSLTGEPVDQVFAYALSAGTWKQIPLQIDEVTPLGFYTGTEDAILDANDELVFMAKDLGDRAQEGGPMVDGRLVSAMWYEVEVTDPLDPAQKGWVYLVRAGELPSTVRTDYVNFNPLLHQIVGENFRLGFGTNHIGLEYMALGGGLVDILDRSKTEVSCRLINLPGVCPITEETLPFLPDLVIKDGPVRVIVRGGRVKGYGSMVLWDRTIVVPQFLSSFVGDIRFSVDFSEAASGSTLYNTVVPDGVTVDGITDTVPAEPMSPWWQLSTDRGAVIQVVDATEIGGTQVNYYVDNATLDESDRGDQRHYGDTGIIISSPNLTFTYQIAHYYLSGSQPNVGETYAAYFSQPLTVTTRLQWAGTPMKAYLPLIRKELAPTPTPTPTPEPTCLGEPGDWTGTESEQSLPLSFTLTSDCKVSGLTITVPFEDDVCTLTADRDLTIFADRFAYVYLGGVVLGEFTSPVEASGTYTITTCDDVTLTSPSTGTWEAQK